MPDAGERRQPGATPGYGAVRPCGANARACAAALLAALAAASDARAADAPRPAVIQFSDGASVTGNVSLTPGSELKLHTGRELRTLTLATVGELRVAPEKESMERQWRFVEAGRTEKKEWGEPYPVRHLRTTVLTRGGGAVTGHLYTTVLYVEAESGTRKVLLDAKQKGKPGDALDSLLYVAGVRFTDAAAAVSGSVRLKLGQGANGLTALTRPALLRLEPAHEASATGEVDLPSPLGAPVILCTRVDGVLRVGWPAARDEVLEARLREGMGQVRDFFDERDVLGACREGDDLYSLMLLSRRGHTTLDAAASQPWRLEVWRWRESGDGKLLVAGRGYFQRGIVVAGAPRPRVECVAGLWNPELRDGMSLP